MSYHVWTHGFGEGQLGQAELDCLGVEDSGGLKVFKSIVQMTTTFFFASNLLMSSGTRHSCQKTWRKREYLMLRRSRCNR